MGGGGRMGQDWGGEYMGMERKVGDGKMLAKDLCGGHVGNVEEEMGEWVCENHARICCRKSLCKVLEPAFVSMFYR